ncbi:MAG: flavin reductase family protein, partial [Ferrovibrio sp.]
MSKLAEFKGAGGFAFKAQSAGNSDDPAIVLLQHDAPYAGFWSELAAALVRAGRQVIQLSPAEAGMGAILPDPVAQTCENLRAVLNQLPSRPVVIAAADHAGGALRVVGEEAVPAVTGLILIDPAIPERDRVTSRPPVPTLAVFGAIGHEARVTDEALAAELADVEVVEIEAGADRLETLSALLIDFLERRLPRSAPEYRLGSDARTLRDALGCFATGVTVLTAKDASGEPVGLTANSFTSVSLDPPLLLACIAQSAGSIEAFR